MAKIIHSQLKTAANEPVGSVSYPLYEPALEVGNIRRLDEDNTKLTSLPDRRAYRSMNRSAVLLAAACLPAKEFVDKTAEDKFRVGFYCATDNGPDNFSCAKGAPENKSEEFAGYYKKNRSPKDYLKQLPNLVPAQVAIFMELVGPLNVYNNSKWGGLQALEQAEFDVTAGLVDYALVAATNSVEDPLRARRRCAELADGQSLAEGAALLVLGQGPAEDWAAHLEKLPKNKNYYGIADAVVRFAEAHG